MRASIVTFRSAAFGIFLLGAGMAGCSGGGSSPEAPISASATPSGNSSTAATTGAVTTTLYVPFSKASGSSDRRRKRNYVPPGTQGLIIVVKQDTGGNQTTYSTTGYTLSTMASTVSTGSPCIEVTSAQAYKCTIALNAPPTTTASSDRFYIYEYDAPQSSIPNSVPAGSLLGEDIGADGNGDPVPSAYVGANSVGIPVNKNTDLTFDLLPVVAMPNAFINGQTGANLVASVTQNSDEPTAPPAGQTPGPGSGGSTSITIDALDAESNDIGNILTGTNGSAFANPLSVNIQPTTVQTADSQGQQFSVQAPTASTVGKFKVSYTATDSDNATADVFFKAPSATLTLSSHFNGGYNLTSNFPFIEQTITIAPLLAVALPTSTDQTNFTIYAVQAALPTGVTTADYTLQSPNCNSSNQLSITPVSSPALSGDARAEWSATEIFFFSNLTCYMVLSDGISNTVFAITLNVSS